MEYLQRFLVLVSMILILDFLSFLTATGEMFYRHPSSYEIHKGDGTQQTDFLAMIVIVSRYLAMQRVYTNKTAGLPDWELRSTSQELGEEEINKELDRLVNDRNFEELNDLTRLVYGMLVYRTGRNRLLPLLRDLGRDFVEGVQ
jgi:hypothetical protein